MGKESKSKAAAAPTAGAAGAAKPAKAKKTGPKKDFYTTHPHLFTKDARDYRIGRDIQPKRDLSRFVKWPRYVRLQRQRAVLKKRLKVPPSIEQFSKTLDKNNADNILRLLGRYRPETKEAKKKRLAEAAKKRAADEKAGGDNKKEEKKGAAAAAEKPRLLKYGINHVTALVESKKAKLVLIAHDVDPIEIVVWLPALCRKMDIPYAIIKSKARLGQLVHKKTATAVAVTEVNQDDVGKLEQVVKSVREIYSAVQKNWGGGVLGHKAQQIVRLRQKAAARDAAKRDAGK
jgi:large subunit ribosomal protein L7Ae